MIDKVKYAKYRVDDKGIYINPEMRKVQFAQYAQKYRVDDNNLYIDPEMRKIQLAKLNKKEKVLGRPKEEVEEMWTEWGANPKQKLSFLDRVENNQGDIDHKYHDPTWTDRAKEFGQGLAGFAGGTVDFGNDLANLVSSKPVETDYRTQWKNQKALRTKNKDTTSYMLRGAGEFVPEIIPAYGGGKLLAKGLTHSVKTAKPLIKNWVGKTANFVKTPITAANIGGFAGAGLTHGALHAPDYTSKEVDIPWYMEMPAVIGGGIAGGIGGSLTGNVLSKTGKTLKTHIVNKLPDSTLKSSKSSNTHIKKNDLGFLQKSLAKYIDNANMDVLDEDFIRAATKGNIDLNAFNIYKDNYRPYGLATMWKNKDYGKILPKMEEGAKSATNKILDENLIPYKNEYDKHQLSEDISKLLNKTYAQRKDISSKKYDLAKSQISPDDAVYPTKTLDKLKELYKSTSDVPGANNTSIQTLNNISNDMLTSLSNAKHPGGKIPLEKLMDMRAVINEHARKVPTDPKSLGKNVNRILDLKKILREDLNENLEKGNIKNKNFLNSQKIANDYYKDYLGEFKNSKLFSKIADHPAIGEKLDVNDTIYKSLNTKGSHNDLETLIENLNKDSKKLHLNSKENLQKLKRLKLNENIFGKKTTSSSDLLQYLKKHSRDPIFESKFDTKGNLIPKILKEDVSPILNKHGKVKKLMSEHDIVTPNAPTVKLTSLTPVVLGSLGGSVYSQSPSSIAAGAALGTGINLAWKASHNNLSKRLHKNLTDKQFVDELIRLGRIKKEDKESMLLNMSKKGIDDGLNSKVLRTQIFRSTHRKNEGEKWGE